MPSHYCRSQTDRLYLKGPFYSKQKIINVYKSKCANDNIVPLSDCYVLNYIAENKLSIFLPKKISVIIVWAKLKIMNTPAHCTQG